jgi:sugar phosphate isomerase/epimerase
VRPPDPEIILPGVTPAGGFTERLAAASAAGIRQVGLAMWNYRAERAAGRTDADLLGDLDRYGVSVCEVEVLNDGLRADEDGATARFADRLFVLAQTFGARRVICNGNRDADLDESAARFARLCDRGAEFGLTLALEFVPWRGTPDLRTAWEIVQRADRPNGGIVLDSWHFFRGDADYSALDLVPPDRIALIQFTDAPAPMAGVDPFEETTHFRRFPGEGVLDLVSLVRALDRRGVRAPISPEIISDELNAMAIEAAVRRMVESTAAVFREARSL